MSKSVTLKIKNATLGDYRFQFRHPRTKKLAVVTIAPLSTTPVIVDDLKTCKEVRESYQNIPDSSNMLMSDSPVQFIWEGLPSLEDYESALAIAEEAGAEEGKEALQEAVNMAADVSAESIPDAKSNVTVRKSNSKSAITAEGSTNA